MTLNASLLAQAAATGASTGVSLSFGAWMAIAVSGVTLFTAVVAATWRLAVISTKTGQLEGWITRELLVINEKLDTIGESNQRAQADDMKDAAWRGRVDERLNSVERFIENAEQTRRIGDQPRKS